MKTHILSFLGLVFLAACSGDSASGGFPQTCSDAQEAAVEETGSRPSNGTFTLYVDGDEQRPWEAYCHDMKKSEPKEFISVDESDNYSQLSVGMSIVETTYRRLRIDPIRLEIDLTDATFASTDDNPSMAMFPDDREHLPVGWAQFGDGSEFGGPTAEAKIDLSGTAFAFSEEASEESFYCTVAAGGDGSASEISIASDRLSVTLTSTNATNSVPTKTVADCDDFGGTETEGDDFAEGALPLEYLGE